MHLLIGAFHNIRTQYFRTRVQDAKKMKKAELSFKNWQIFWKMGVFSRKASIGTTVTELAAYSIAIFILVSRIVEVGLFIVNVRIN